MAQGDRGRADHEDIEEVSTARISPPLIPAQAKIVRTKRTGNAHRDMLI
jgi:hypothetical protein